MDTAQSMAVEAGHAVTPVALRAPSVTALPGGAAVAGENRPDPEVREEQPCLPAGRAYRRLTAEYKLRILREADACGPGGVAALLRREGLYSSHLTRWRAQRDRGVLDALVSRKRGRKEDAAAPWRKKLAKLEHENERLKKRLKQAETIIEVQKKVSEMLGISLESSENGGRNE